MEAVLEDSDAATVATDLSDAFADAVGRHPHRTAIIHNGAELSYGQLGALVESTAAALGPRPGVVGVVTTRSPATVIGLLGILAAGGAYCPIDPSFPPPRQRAMLAAAGCRAVLTPEPAPELIEGLRTVALSEIPVSGPGSARAGTPTDPAVLASGPGSAPTDPAYILFTSGSTGQPKPVVTPRRAISTTVSSLRDLFGITPDDRVLQFASLNWDTCFEEILPALTSGAALVFDDQAYTGSFPRFLRAVADRGVTVLDLPTAFWHELVRHLSEDRAPLPAGVRLMIIGGEAASPARLTDWAALATSDGQHDSGVQLMNTYGCTETTLITHAIDLAGADPARIPIGRALPHVRERISDEGELLIGGPALALGYLGLPEATRERFIETSDGIYFRTGDRVSRRGDGALLHEGRLDHAVKIRGVRVDPGEVESQIALHPGVSAVAVIGVTLAGRTALIAYVVGDGADDLLAWLRNRVPAHLVPSQITFVPELAHTASGKTDRLGTHRRYTSKETSR